MAELTDAARRAARFVESRGDDLARCRALAQVGLTPVARAIEMLEPRVAASRPGIDLDPTVRAADGLRVLGILDDLGALDTPLSERTCVGLSQSQGADGSWRHDPFAVDEEWIFSAGMIAGYLAKTPFVRQHTLDAAADCLAAHWDPDRVVGSAWGAIAAFSHCFSLIHHDAADGILQWCGRELERGFRTRSYDAVRTARVFALCRAHGLPGARISRGELTAQLLAEQEIDGGFTRGADKSLPARVAHTLDALTALDALKSGEECHA